MSNEIGKKIQSITSVTANQGSVNRTRATIIDADEKSNRCKVSFTNRDGSSETRANVPVALSNSSVFDWFPEKGDIVLVQEKDGTIFIIGPGYDNYDEVRRNIKTERDMLADTFGSFFGGSVF